MKQVINKLVRELRDTPFESQLIIVDRMTIIDKFSKMGSNAQFIYNITKSWVLYYINEANSNNEELCQEAESIFIDLCVDKQLILIKRALLETEKWCGIKDIF